MRARGTVQAAALSSASQQPPDVAVALRALRKVYGRGAAEVRALDGVDADFCRGTFTAVMGPSGSGKSTLLHCAAGLDQPSAGTAWLAGTDLAGLSETALTKLRRTRIGFVFQAFNLVPALSVGRTSCCPRGWLIPALIVAGWPRSWRGWAWMGGCGTARRSFPAVSSSGWPSSARSRSAPR